MPGVSFIHRMPALFKVILLFAFPVGIFLLPLPYVIALSGICIVLSLYTGFSIFQQIRDIRPIVLYCAFLLIVHIVLIVLSQKPDTMAVVTLSIKLICSMQYTSLFFKTTTSLALQEALEKILPYTVSRTFSLFINFIPMLFSVWFQLNKTWKARAGKNTVTKIIVLLPIFISIALHKAYNIFLTLQNRS